MKFLHGIYVFLIITLIVMPQYFGIHIGYDLTCSRFVDIGLTVYLMMCPFVLTHFWRASSRCSVLYPLLSYVAVGFYTMIFRTDLNAFFLIFLEVYTFFLTIYGVRYVIGYKKALELIIGCAYFLVIYGFVEYLCGRSLFLKFLATMPTRVSNSYRSGHYRIMGPCGHSLAYGMLLLIFIAIGSYDSEKDELYLFRRPVLLAMLIANVFLTGSRSTLGIAALECLLILLFSKGISLQKTLVFSAFTLVLGSIALVLFQNTGMGRYFIGQMLSIIDQFFDTEFATQFGISTTTLQNSSRYREALPYIFTLDWLNPLLGRGSYFGGAEVNGIYVHSIDNYYVLQYIKYAYPGLVCYVLFMIVLLCDLLHEIYRYRTGMAKMTLIAAFCYFLNLWWVDALQTLKFIYLLLAVYYACQLERKDGLRSMKIKGNKPA